MKIKYVYIGVFCNNHILYFVSIWFLDLLLIICVYFLVICYVKFFEQYLLYLENVLCLRYGYIDFKVDDREKYK